MVFVTFGAATTAGAAAGAATTSTFTFGAATTAASSPFFLFISFAAIASLSESCDKNELSDDSLSVLVSKLSCLFMPLPSATFIFS